MSWLALVPNLATRWRNLHQSEIWPPDSATCINFTTRWHHLHQLQICCPGWVTCIATFALDCLLAFNNMTKWHNLHWSPGCITCIATLPWIALLTLSISIELVSSSARVNSVKFHKGLSVTDRRTDGLKDRTPGTPGSDRKWVCIKRRRVNTGK